MGGVGEILAALVFPLLAIAATVWAVHRYAPRARGVVLASESELEAFAPRVGTYHGCEIHDWVRYKGSRYEFAYVAAPAYQARLKKNELYLPPGLVYVRADAAF
jgi:hypothetical protein